MDKTALATRITRVVAELQALYRELLEEEAVFPKAKQSLIDAGTCLNCGEPLTSKRTRPIRGNHESCYREIKRQIDSGALTESEAISAGLLYYKSLGGRPPRKTAIKEHLANEDRRSSKKAKR